MNEQDYTQPTQPENEIALVFSGSHGQVMEASLVLASQDISHTILQYQQKWELYTEPEWAQKALKILRVYQRENKARVITIPSLELQVTPLLILIIPVFFFFWSMWHSYAWQIKMAGAANASKILSGEWWRIITATTLHSDLKHFASNMVSGYFVLNLLLIRVRVGASALFLLLAAMVANYTVALTMQANFQSIGFSTYVFAALGALAGIEVRVAWGTKSHVSLFRRLQPLYSALFVAIMLGMGENSDVFGHFYSFFWGIPTGLLLLQIAPVVSENSGEGAWQKPSTNLHNFYAIIFYFCTWLLVGLGWTLAL
jgi:rhomboid protease GluP